MIDKLPRGELELDQTLLPWSDARCVLCTLELPLTNEHVIPRALGGILECKFLCEPCNRMMGELYEGGLLDSPEIRLAIEPLRSTAPGAYRQMVGRRLFILDGPGGSVEAVMQDGRIAAVSNTEWRDNEQVDTFGSVSATKRALRDGLADQGMGADQIELAIQRVAAATPDTRVPIAPSVEFANWTATGCTPTLAGRLADDRFALKIAYEFLAICLGDQIYHPGFEAIRTCLREKAPLPEMICLDGKRARAYSPTHSLLFRTSEVGTIVDVRLFGYLVWTVSFPNAGPHDFPKIGYRLDLSKGRHTGWPYSIHPPEANDALRHRLAFAGAGDHHAGDEAGGSGEERGPLNGLAVERLVDGDTEAGDSHDEAHNGQITASVHSCDCIAGLPGGARLENIDGHAVGYFAVGFEGKRERSRSAQFRRQGPDVELVQTAKCPLRSGVMHGNRYAAERYADAVERGTVAEAGAVEDQV